MIVPDSQACGNQFSSVVPIPASQTAAGIAQTGMLDAAVAEGNQAAQNLFVANPWESWQGGMNLMRDIVRGNTQVSGSGGPPQLPGLPPANAGPNLLDWLRGKRGGASRGGNARNARQVAGWNSRFVKGPGGKFQTWPPPASSQVVDCQVDAADVVPSDGIVQPGAPEPSVSQPPPNPSLTTDQPVNIIIQPPAQYGCLAKTGSCAAGMGEWTDSLAKPGAVPSDCVSGSSGTSAVAGLPWWLWALAGVAVLAVANSGGRSGGQKRAA